MFLDSFFSAGSAQTALAVGEALRVAGHTVQFIPCNGGESKLQWWADLSGFRADWTVGGSDGLDLVIEVGWNFLAPTERAKAKRSVWLCRKAPLLQDIEASLFPFTPASRNLDGVSEIWLFDELVSKDDVQYVELLTRKPVRLVPFVWTPSAAEVYRREVKAPVWQQVAALPEAASLPWSPIICETNVSNTSSCTIPLFIYRRIVQEGIPIGKTLRVSNGENVRVTQFFKYNVLDHVTDVDGCPGMADREVEFVGRMRSVDYVYTPKSIVLAHSRFCSLRPYLLDLAWVGVPFVHNSVVLAQRLGLEEGLYLDNDILSGAAAYAKVTAASLKTNVETLMELRKKILEEFSPMSSRIHRAFSEAAIAGMTSASASTSSTTSIASTSTTSTASASTSSTTSIASTSTTSTASASTTSTSPTTASAPFRVGFTCMWDGFNAEYNMFILMLQAAYQGRPVVGVDVTHHPIGQEQCDVLIFGPFAPADRWKDVREDIPKIHYTGENTAPVKEAKLNLGFKHMDGVGDEYLRLPLWMLEINWFRADVDRIQNPKPLPIHACTKVFPEDLAKKSKFCAFVVTNPCQPARNLAFQWLHSYKGVDSAGRLYNNIGEEIFAGLGGGGGELKKHEFLKSYKFCLAYENASEPGYCTEKLLHAKAAGCIPIYWGDPKVERDFNLDGCIDARQFQTKEQLVQAVRKVDEDAGLWLRKFSVPALDDVARDKVRRTLSECARRIWALGGLSAEEQAKIPRFIGYTSDADAVEQTKVLVVQEEEESKPNDSLLLVTAASQTFLPSLHIWLQCADALVKAIGCKVRVYWFADVGESVRTEMQTKYPFLESRSFPTEAPQDFPDLWEPKHFAWKLWIYQTIVQEEALKGTLVFYADAGIMIRSIDILRDGWFTKVKQEGICLLDDSEQKNRSWCHTTFVKEMQMTEAELEGHQVVAGIVSFVAGHSKAKQLFADAWQVGQKRHLITGPKWAGPGLGHRHDQSIVSLLSQRQGIARYPLHETIYSDHSLRDCYLRGKALYVHRGNFCVQKQVLEGIDDAWVINLDRRPDRMEKFRANQPLLAERALRLPAFEGSKLLLTPAIARLFAPHDFKWKKAVMGCALSHLALWTKLVTDAPEVQSYLILEDDARLMPIWRDRWEDMMAEKALPEDWDVVYLGGILPPNREGFAQVIEPVNDFIGRVKEHSFFGQNPPNRYFHFCAYAYVLSRRGAQKVLDVLRAKEGYWTSADHMICNLNGLLNMYFMNPLVAGCYQDDDPVYQQSQFNDFSRKDTFDSDLWNNTEHFTEAEVAAVMHKEAPLDILKALEDARDAMKQKKKEVETVVKVQTMQREQREQTVQKEITLTNTIPSFAITGKRRIVTLGEGMKQFDLSGLYEYGWLKQLLQENAEISLHVEHVTEPQDDAPIVIYQRPHTEEIQHYLEVWRAAGKSFYLLHLSDEFGTDSIGLYDWPECKGVLRNYVRKDAPNSAKVKTIPLGFHWAILNGEPYIHTPSPPFREFVWSFVGTGWQGRGAKLQVLEGTPTHHTGGWDHKVVLQDDWNSKDMLGREETLGVLLNSWFVPCPGGQNGETFRIYEALEAGAMPVLVKEEGMEEVLGLLGKWLPLLVATSWQHAAGLIHTLREKPEVYEQYRMQVLGGWEKCKKEVKGWVKEVFGV